MAHVGHLGKSINEYEPRIQAIQSWIFDKKRLDFSGNRQDEVRMNGLTAAILLVLGFITSIRV
jgi:hypothetical protein